MNAHWRGVLELYCVDLVLCTSYRSIMWQHVLGFKCILVWNFLVSFEVQTWGHHKPLKLSLTAFRYTAVLCFFLFVLSHMKKYYNFNFWSQLSLQMWIKSMIQQFVVCAEQEIPCSYGNGRYITMFTKTSNLTTFLLNPVLIHIFTACSHLNTILPSTPKLPKGALWEFLFLPYSLCVSFLYECYTSHSSHLSNVGWRELLVM